MVYLKEEPYGGTVKKYTWTTNSGFSVSAISYGAIITEIKVPDKFGQKEDVVLGFDDLESYTKNNVAYFGAVIGRVANRIGKGEFEIDGKKYQVAKNIGNNHLHGGLVGFDKKVWETTVIGTKVTFSYLSADGEEGYPGALVTNVSYDVTDDGGLIIEYVAATTKRTLVNLTNHSYFNLAGHAGGAEELYEHYVTINADKITETDSDSIPTGKLKAVGGTPYDLRTSTKLGKLLDSDKKLFDDNFCISNYRKNEWNFVARASHQSSGRYLEVYSDQPGVQFYTTYYLPGPDAKAIVGKSGVGYRRHGAFCFETQKFPDAIHHPEFETTILSPGELYTHKVKYIFGAEKDHSPSVIVN